MFKRRPPKPDLEQLLDLMQLVHKALLDYIENPPESSKTNEAETLLHLNHKAGQIQFTIEAARYLLERRRE